MVMCSVFIVLSILWTHTQGSCVTPLGATSDCVSLYDCSSLLAAFELRPLPSEVTSFLRQSACGFEGFVPRVCCGPLPNLQPARPTTERPRTTTRPSNQGSETLSDEDLIPASQNQCGIDTNGDRIYGGQFTDLDEFPWMALLGYRKRDGSLTYQCGGVLLNRRFVLTAAHCVIGAIEREVGTIASCRLGEYDTSNEIDCLDDVCASPPQDIPTQAAYPHRGYSDQNKNRQDDIAIVKLSRRAQYTNFVKPICLISNTARLADNTLYVAGWGKTLNGRNSPIKLKLGLPVFDKNDCISKYRTLGAELTNRQICAGGVFAEDACRGDSGGPLMKKRNDGIWEVAAVVSFGYGCGRDGWPGVYTSVASYADWIRSTMKNAN